MKLHTYLTLGALVLAGAIAADPPHEPDTAPGCFQWIQAIAGDDCNSLAQADNVPLEQFLLWNPTLKKSCGDVKVGYNYCTGSKQTVPDPKPPTTTPTTPEPPKPTLDVGMFPPSKGALQCVTSGNPIKNPTSITSGRTLLASINSACTNIVGTALWLEKGLPYIGSVKVGDHATTFALQIKLGGFSVTNEFCRQQLTAALNGCTTAGKTFGGCCYTSDFNLLACILP